MRWCALKDGKKLQKICDNFETIGEIDKITM